MQAREALRANCCAHHAARPDPSPVCKRYGCLTFARCAAEARGSWMLQREAESEVASCRDSRRTAAAPRTEYAAALQSRWTRLAPLRATAAAAMLLWCGGMQMLHQPSCRAEQQRQLCERVSECTQPAPSQRAAAALCASHVTCAIVIVCVLAAHGVTMRRRVALRLRRDSSGQQRVNPLWAGSLQLCLL